MGESDLQHRLTDPSRPTLVGYGPSEFATTMAVEPWPFIWDVNLYYRDLGLALPYRHNRKQIRQAYMSNDGHNSNRLTMIVKTLLDPKQRIKYDTMRPGETFIDLEIIDRLHSLLADDGDSNDENDDDDVAPIKELLDELVETMEGYLDRSIPSDLIWSYYVWNCAPMLTDARRSLLAEWRGLISKYLAESTCTLDTAGVGFVSGQGVAVTKVGFRWVFLIGEHAIPNDVLASQAVLEFEHQHNQNHKHTTAESENKK